MKNKFGESEVLFFFIYKSSEYKLQNVLKYFYPIFCLDEDTLKKFSYDIVNKIPFEYFAWMLEFQPNEKLFSLYDAYVLKKLINFEEKSYEELHDILFNLEKMLVYSKENYLVEERLALIFKYISLKEDIEKDIQRKNMSLLLKCVVNNTHNMWQNTFQFILTYSNNINYSLLFGRNISEETYLTIVNYYNNLKQIETYKQEVILYKYCSILSTHFFNKINLDHWMCLCMNIGYVNYLSILTELENVSVDVKKYKKYFCDRILNDYLNDILNGDVLNNMHYFEKYGLMLNDDSITKRVSQYVRDKKNILINSLNHFYNERKDIVIISNLIPFLVVDSIYNTKSLECLLSLLEESKNPLIISGIHKATVNNNEVSLIMHKIINSIINNIDLIKEKKYEQYLISLISYVDFQNNEDLFDKLISLNNEKITTECNCIIAKMIQA